MHPETWIQRPCALKSIITPPRLGSCACSACPPRQEAEQPGLRAEQPTSACGGAGAGAAGFEEALPRLLRDCSPQAMSHPGRKAPGPGGLGMAWSCGRGRERGLDRTERSPRPQPLRWEASGPRGSDSPRVKAPHRAGAHQPPKWNRGACSPSGCPPRDCAWQAPCSLSQGLKFPEEKAVAGRAVR